MSSQSLRHHANHHKHHHGWFSTNDHSPVYVVESTVTTSPMHQNVHVTLSNGRKERVLEAPARVRVIEYDLLSPPPRVNSGIYEACMDEIDKEAEEFIKLEHKKFGY